MLCRQLLSWCLHSRPETLHGLLEPGLLVGSLDGSVSSQCSSFYRCQVTFPVQHHFQYDVSILREGSQTEPNGLAARLMPLPMMNAHPISTVAKPMANANGRQSLMVYRSQDADGGRSMCADLLNWRLIATA